MLKYKTLFLCAILLCITSFYISYGKEKALPLFGKMIYVDAGHGGMDPGAIYKNIHEKQINLEISKKLVKSLEKLGATVYMTRYDDYDLSIQNTNSVKRSDLSRRAIMINESNCDLYISIHLNSDLSPTWHGTQIFYDDVNMENEKLAKIMQETFQEEMKSNRKYKELTNIYLYRKVKRPGVLVEAGFLSNPNDRYLLRQKTHQQKIVNTIIKSILKYYKL